MYFVLIPKLFWKMGIVGPTLLLSICFVALGILAPIISVQNLHQQVSLLIGKMDGVYSQLGGNAPTDIPQTDHLHYGKLYTSFSLPFRL